MFVLLQIFAMSQPINPNDPNTDPNWDWIKGDYPERPDPAYRFWIWDNGQILSKPINAPLSQGNYWWGLKDNKKEDGWRLLARDFGTPFRPCRGPDTQNQAYFVLYNIHKSLLRIFVFIYTTSEKNKAWIKLSLPNREKSPAVLAHLKPLSAALDRKIELNENIGTQYSEECKDGWWIWGDFPLSYDYSSTPKNDNDPPTLFFEVFGQDISNLDLKGVFQGVSGSSALVNKWLTDAQFANASVGIPGIGYPNLQVNPNFGDINLDGLNLKPFATQTDWSSFTNYFSKIKVKIPTVSSSNPFKNIFNNFSLKVSSFSNLLPINLPGMDIGGLVDFMIGGGSKSSKSMEAAPSFIAMNLELKGTIEKTVPLHKIHITIPHTTTEYWKPPIGNVAGIVWNDQVGIFTLTKTPKLIGKIVYKRIYLSSGYYVDIPYYEYEVSENLQYQINPASGLYLKKLEAYLITDFNYVVDDRYNWLTNIVESNNQNYMIELESPKNESNIVIRSMPVPEKYFKGRKLLSGIRQKDIYVKVKAILKRIDDPDSQPVVFISTYKTEKPLEYSIYEYGNYQQLPQPTIPPQNIIYSFPSSGGIKISWDKNYEKNIKYYSIERSINNGTYIVIGTTPGTDFLDTEIQKAVNPYTAFSKNVNVNYRIRAMSEWFDENNIMRQQFSGYSDVLYVYGSMQFGPLDKRQDSPIIPESNSLSQNFPNPFNPSTTIYYAVKDEGNVNITVFNSLGQEISTLVNDRKQAGYHYVEWNAAGYPSGVYFYRISNGDYVETKRMVLMK